jgi:alkanesulfonate monooxygenase SsuD/methylene tetrahydromethanopterin reductase-like flavin-dependent oxidoreductase (luciferase family)
MCGGLREGRRARREPICRAGARPGNRVPCPRFVGRVSVNTVATTPGQQGRRPDDSRARNEGIKLGALLWSQYSDWDSLRAASQVVDRSGYDDLWTWDHHYPIVGSPAGPIFDGWLVLAAWAEVTRKARLGLMVGANTFRNPALVAKMATTLDHLSSGRAILGIGAGWFEAEHVAYGVPFGSSPGERLRWLEEAVGIVRGMLRGQEPSGEQQYTARRVRNEPPPVQARLPILIGGGGERKTLRIVARYADACNIGSGSGLEAVKRKEQALRRHCLEVGRDEAEIERTVGMGICMIRDDPAEAERLARRQLDHNGNADPDVHLQSTATTTSMLLVGTPEQVADRMRPFAALGYRHFIVGFPAPYDVESIVRLSTEVRAALIS